MPQASLRRQVYIHSVATVFLAYFRLYHRLKIEGVENVPLHGPLFVLINHISFLEPFALGLGLMKRPLLPSVDIFTVAKKELYSVKPIGKFLDSLGFFPIDRERMDMTAMRTMLNILKQNKIIAMAPEGTRSPTGQLQAFQPVVAKIAISRHIPILPVGAFGVEKAMPVGTKFPRPYPITIRFGPVFELAEYYNIALTEEQADRASWVMRAHIAELLPEWMRQLPPPTQRVGARKI
ncbi:MAG: 1-acyl-sn-glycerol-3-phosphate acyltransferase [Chloroflexi bacterium]|nr:1-acyl-sn-glycerol-3-phosphate acyltransferase [Chloroflexota bacterium]